MITGPVLPLLCSLLVARAPHPIHAARVEFEATAAGAVTVVVHVYRDDFPPGVKVADINSYFDRVLVVTDARGSRIALRESTIGPDGDRLQIVLTGSSRTPLTGGHIALTLLQEKFEDQVNVVDARMPGHRVQMVFLRGDAPQMLP